MSELQSRVTPAVLAALMALACLVFSLSSRRESAAQAERAPRYQLSSSPTGAGYRLFLVDSATGDVWEYGSNFGEKSFVKLLAGPK